jgi:hypothetical protein
MTDSGELKSFPQSPHRKRVELRCLHRLFTATHQTLQNPFRINLAMPVLDVLVDGARVIADAQVTEFADKVIVLGARCHTDSMGKLGIPQIDIFERGRLRILPFWGGCPAPVIRRSW